MGDFPQELLRKFVIINNFGLHARPAAKIAEIAQKAKSRVWLIRGDEKVDASSIIDILTLACLKGTTVTLQIEDQADIEILNVISELIENGFGE